MITIIIIIIFIIIIILIRKQWQLTQDLEAAHGLNFRLMFSTTPLQWHKETQHPAAISHS